MSIKVITPGMLSTIQDGGRKGFAAMGVNASGVMDGSRNRDDISRRFL